MDKLIAALLSGSAMTYLLGWIAGRKKKQADLEGKRLKNLEKSVDLYERIHLELREQMTRLSDKCSKLSSKIDEMKAENQNLSLKIDVMRKENESLRNEIISLNIKLNNQNNQ